MVSVLGIGTVTKTLGKWGFRVYFELNFFNHNILIWLTKHVTKQIVPSG